ncbi:Stress up-regulated Nod 19 [Artemisia annua]|uniref:Stress up-regulated Nod 19 n=1 Tax=Artemisia annua TaxID=35608 RepID=A0A2U1MEK6_ARTAN|nr:Stress up-regulated Nod 19 [Artemisia annua]
MCLISENPISDFNFLNRKVKLSETITHLEVNNSNVYAARNDHKRNSKYPKHSRIIPSQSCLLRVLSNATSNIKIKPCGRRHADRHPVKFLEATSRAFQGVYSSHVQTLISSDDTGLRPIYGEGNGVGDEAGYIVGMSTCYPEPGSIKIANGEILTFGIHEESKVTIVFWGAAEFGLAIFASVVVVIREKSTGKKDTSLLHLEWLISPIFDNWNAT